MISVAVRKGLLGAEVHHLGALDPGRGPRTPRALLDQIQPTMPQSVPVGIAVDGCMVMGDALDEPFPPSCQVIIAPQTSYGAGETALGILINTVISLLISAAISYVAYLLSPRQKAPGVGQERGEESSQTYSWDGIKTNFGPGLPIPWAYGRHALGGQVIWTDVEANRAAGAVDDRLRIMLSLCEGPIHRIGDRLAGHVDDLGGFQRAGSQPATEPFPAGISVNGNQVPATLTPDARCWMRSGTQDQPPFPEPFAGVAQTSSPQAELTERDQSAVYTFADASEIETLGFVFTFPAGLYEQLPTGQLDSTSVSFGVEIRQVGATAWTALQGPGAGSPSGGTPFVGYHAHSHRINLRAALPGVTITGPLEVRVTRLTDSGGTQTVNSAIWRDLVVITPHTLRYPEEALLALELLSGERFQGGLPNVKTTCECTLVRVWSEQHGWSERCWDVPAAPFDFHTYAPGRNPAWCTVDFLLAPWGLGRWIDESKIDLPAFRRWAAYCDQDPNPAEPWGEPQFTVDLVGDTPRPVWEWVLAFCAAGRATPVIRNGKISVVYQYRDAHGDSEVQVPAKRPVQLLTSANVEDLQVTWLSRKNRPTVYQFQFLNEEADYEQDVFPVEDDEGSLNDPSALDKDQYRSEDVQAYGATRASQLYREGVWRHRIQANVRREVTCTAGPWTLAAEIGDLVSVEHETLRPFGDDAPTSMQVRDGGEQTTTIVVDHELAGETLHIIWRDEDGEPRELPIDSYTNGAGVAVVNFAAPVDIESGTTCVIGVPGKLVETYEVYGITLQKDLKRHVRMLQWTPEAYEPISQAAFEQGTQDFGAPASVLDEPSGSEAPPAALGVRLVPQQDGGHLVVFARPATLAARAARVWLRPAGGDWSLVGTTDRNDLHVPGLIAGRSYQVSVCLENARGHIVPPQLGTIVDVAPEEFVRVQLPKLSNARATVLEGGVLVRWDELQQRGLDYFEVRAGSQWLGAPVVWRGRAPRVMLEEIPRGVPLLVAARASSGLYGPISRIEAPGWTPSGAVLLAVDDLPTTGVLTDLVLAGDGALEVAADRLSGVYESAVHDLTFQAPFRWSVLVDRAEIHDVRVADCEFELGSGEARWRTLAGRPPSPLRPGLDWQTRVADLQVPIGDVSKDLRLGGPPGEIGSHTQALVESRFLVDDEWTGYREHVDRVVLASAVQVRITMNRRSLAHQVRVPLLRYEAHL